MGFWDFLKGIIPEKLVNINVDNRKIEISHSSLIFGDQTINDQKIVDQILEKLSEYKDKESLPCQIIHKDLEQSYLDYEDLSISQKESIAKLRVVLPAEEIECVLMARRVKSAYEKDVTLGKKLHKQLDDAYPKKGFKIYNLIGGGYFDEIIIPFIDIFKAQYEEKYMEKYRDFYNDLITFFPLAFFVGNGTTEDNIITGLTERLKTDVPFVRLHAIGQNNIEKIENTIKNLKIEDNYSTKDNRFTSPTGLKVQIFEIKTKEKK